MASSNTIKCNICLEEDIKDPVFTPCIHGFCNECISKWLSEKKQYMRIPCPVCKYNIAELAGPRDESDLYDEDEPLPAALLRAAIGQAILNIPIITPADQNPQTIMRGLGIEEMIRPELRPNIFREAQRQMQGLPVNIVPAAAMLQRNAVPNRNVLNRNPVPRMPANLAPQRNPVQRMPPNLAPRSTSSNLQHNLEALMRMIEERRQQLQRRSDLAHEMASLD